MDMLDATLAFALTLAALATIVTIILEAIHRLLRVRKWNLILTLKKLSGDIKNDNIFSGRCCWDFVVNVLNNGTRPDQQKLIPSKELLNQEKTGGSSLNRFASFLWDKVFTFSFAKMQMPNKADDESWIKSINSLQRNNATRGVFDKVSIEHVLRRFTELDEVKEKLDESRELVEAQLDKIVRKYEEFTSSVTADFKRRSQMWSIIIGVIIALAANVNAARIFESYLKDQNLSARVIGKFEQYEKQAKEAQQKLDKVLEKKKTNTEDKYADQITKKKEEIADLIKGKEKLSAKKLDEEIQKQQQELQDLIHKAYAESEAGKAQQALNDAGEKLRSLSELGVPIGIRYFPHCMYIDDADSMSTDKKEDKSESKNSIDAIIEWFKGLTEKSTADAQGENDKATKMPKNICLPEQKQKGLFSHWLMWLISTGLTGVLIGMGAPFWFDVARRIAEVRSMFGGKADNEKRLSGKDVDGDQKKRKKLLKNIVDDAVADKNLSQGTS